MHRDIDASWRKLISCLLLHKIFIIQMTLYTYAHTLLLHTETHNAQNLAFEHVRTCTCITLLPGILLFTVC